MKKFEYHLLPVTSGFFSGLDLAAAAAQLNQLGQLGWELVTTADTIVGGNRGLLFTFRRELAG